MKNTYTIFLLMLLASSIAFSPLTSMIKVGYALPGPRIYLGTPNPTFYSNDTSVGQRFNVSVFVENATNLGGAQVYMEFNDTVINATQWFVPSADPQFFMPQPPAPTALPAPPDLSYVHISSGLGSIGALAVLKGGTPPVAPWGHAGLILTIEFEIKTAPPVGGQVTSQLHINATDTFMVDGDTGFNVPNVTIEDGTFTYVYVAPPVTGHIWLETSPTTYTATKPRPFNVTVLIQNVSDTDELIGAQLELRYNSTFLQATNIYPGTFFNNSLWAPFNTFQVSSTDEPGRALYGELILPNDTGFWNPPFPDGNGTVVTVTFLPLLHEATSFDITINGVFGNFFLNSAGEFMPFAPPRNLTYTYSPIAKPTLGVTPNKYIASHFGETFNLDITLTNLVPEWQLMHTDFTLRYNSSFLAVLNVTEGSFLSGFGNTTFAYDEGTGFVHVHLDVVPTSVYPSGSGTLATLEFNATTRPPATSALILNNTDFEDSGFFDIVLDVSNGFYTMNEVLVHPIVWDSVTYNIVTVANVSVSPVPMIFNPDNRFVYFNATGWGTPGFVNVTIPRALMYGDSKWTVFVSGLPVTPIVTDLNATHTMLSIVYNFGTDPPVQIIGIWAIPEFSAGFVSAILALVAMASTVIAAVAYKKRRMFGSIK